MNHRIARAAALCFTGFLSAGAIAQLVDQGYLGPAPWLDPNRAPPLAEPSFLPKAVVPVAALDTSSKLLVRSAYKTYYDLSMPALGWTGSIAGCLPGTISLAWQEWFVSRINFVRAMAGVSGNTVIDSTQNTLEQAAAHLMAANNQLSHFPPNTWTCWTQTGYDGAGQSNLALGYSDALVGYMSDDGTPSAGHRRWILHTAKGKFSIGQANSANALYAFDFTGSSSATQGIPWPPRGYVPIQLFPGSGYWSFGYAGASFGSASVTVTRNGIGVPVSIVSSVDNGYGDNTIVWQMPGGAIVKGEVYNVTVSNIGATPQGSYSYQVLPFDPADPAGIVRSDFNADSHSDILWRNFNTGQLWRQLMNGASVSNGSMAYTELNLNWKVIGDGDFDGDGVTDLLWRDSVSGTVSIQFFGVTGQPTGVVAIYTEPNATWKVLFTPDIDGDGKSDVLWWNSATGQVYATLMNGSTIKAQGTVYQEPNTAWRIVAVGDFAGSGKQNQLLWRNSVNGQVYMQTVNYLGASSFSPSGAMIYTEPNAAWKILAAPDLDGDGKSDILWRNDVSGQVYGMLMNNTTISSQARVHSEPNTAWKVVAHGDYNGDGRGDILWRNEVTGQVYMMLMNGLAISSQAMVYMEPNTAWRILGPLEYSQ
jgi:hypothetical protein